MAEIIVSFEGRTRDLNDFVFDLFEQHLLQEGITKEAPGEVTVVLKPMKMGKSALMQATMQVGLSLGSNVAVSLFAQWLYDKWKKNGEKQISVKIENRLYQFDPALLAKAIEGAAVKPPTKKPAASAVEAPSQRRPVSGGGKGRKILT
jgi:hypothetical protein